MKKIITMFLAAALFLSSLACLPSSTLGTVLAEGAEEICGHMADGFNVETQNYSPSNCASPLQSYLAATTDGWLMRVQADAVDGHYYAEYYDKSYQLRDTVLVKQELPIFGGFYATESNYYILSGQNNPEERADVECFRITKYDLNWKRLTSVGLYDCNTYIPFDAGSARMTHSGNMLLIRTCHEMYQSSDGYHHQANVTIQVNTDTMQITDSLTDVMNVDYGYVSHSFNQFIRVENDHIVAVDHGDAHLRGITLIKYPTNVSSGKFVTWLCETTVLQSFAGNLGDNYTGASVGGFEISDSSYLVAYNSVPQDENFKDYETRNVFVAVMDKATGKVTNRQITDYAEGAVSASTPHLVKISGNAFLLLWSLAGNVYYTKLDGSGSPIGDTYCMRGAFLSDCTPVVYGDKAVWYTWKNGVITFYDIDTKDVSKNSRITDDRIEVISFPTRGGENCTIKCTVCGHTETFATMRMLRVFWGTELHWSVSPLGAASFDLRIGTRLYFDVDTRDQPYGDWSLSVTNLNNGKTLEDDSMGLTTVFSPTPTKDGYFRFDKPGIYEITFSYRFNPLLTCTEVVEITCQHEFGAWSSTGKNLHAHTCSICGQTLAEAHKWDEGTMIEDPAGNMKHYTCTVCGETRTVLASLGDVNNNGEIDATDYLLLKRFCLGTFKLTEEQMAVADVNNDGEINALDYMLVKRHVLGTFKIV